MSAVRRVAVALLAALAGAAGTSAQMPDVRQMSGIPMPAADVPAGSIVVRVIRGDLSSNVPDQLVELHAGGQVMSAKTDATGRATFAGVSGADAHAIAVVDGERIESSHIALPPDMGVRVMLAAGVGAGPAAAAASTLPAVEGEVTFGGQTRIQVEFDDDQLEVFYLLDIVNRGTAPVAPKHDLEIALPAEAQSPAMLEGSSPQAMLRGRSVVVTGPFAPGTTSVQIAFGLAGGPSTRTLTQVWPAALDQVQVIVARVGRVQIASGQFAGVSEMPGDGRAFLLGTGAALPAGTPLEVTLTGLPSRGHAGRWLTLALGTLVLCAGAWKAFGSRAVSAADGRRAQLETRRQKLLGDLARLEQLRRSGKADPGRYPRKREELLGQLERVYGELDQSGNAAGIG